MFVAMVSYAEDRVALVIANTNYQNATINNASAISEGIVKTLEGLGFRVNFLQNSDRYSIDKAIREYRQKLRNGSIGIFYYLGHAYRVSNKNYLVSVAPSIHSFNDLRSHSIDFSRVLEEFDRNSVGKNLIVIDSLSNKYFHDERNSRFRKLTYVDAPKNSAVILSSRKRFIMPNDKDNFIFSKIFTNAIQMRGVSLDYMIRGIKQTVSSQSNGSQIVWSTSSLVKEVILNRPLLMAGPSGEKRVTKSGKKNVIVDVFFGTDRKFKKNNPLSTRYSSGMGEFSYGLAKVSIPKKHKLGELESPKWWKFEFKADTNKHVILKKIENLSMTSFFEKMKSKMKKTKNEDIFVFIHGFNVTFEDSVRRTAQLAYDLNYPGIPVAYSWPSQGTSIDYLADKDRATWSYPHLKEFLVTLNKKANARKIHVLAHSMGNRVLLNALKDIDSNAVRLNQVILAAPDINSRIFIDQIEPRLRRKAERYTLYTSSHDRALIVANTLQKSHRLGQSGKEMVVIDGIDTIDASGIDTNALGHSYYGDERELLFDLYNLIKNGMPPYARNLDKKFKDGAGNYWSLRQ